MNSKFARTQILLFALAVSLRNEFAESAEIQFKATGDVRGSLVLLGDVATIRDQDSQLVERLKRIELFPAPAAGRIRTLRDVELRQLLQLHGVNPAEHRFSGAESVCIAHAKSTSPAPMTPPDSATQKPDQLVVVARQSIAAGTVIRAADVELKPAENTLTGGSAAEAVDAVIGFQSSRSYAAGQTIDPKSLRKPILVRRGDTLIVIAKAAGVQVRTTAKALADAAFGDLIPVESLARDKRQSGEVDRYSAVVTGARQAEVSASGAEVVQSRSGPVNAPQGNQ
jgi:flagella basal body P-ring formation protein FlgA